ncbi:hypothetical protein HHK36_024588 [Tetracentron sinense]|uniref:Uncharacterized protein n=1 Tax=Tetracentron sinense TaxID=13715 RepID=A0A834YQ97_TETSI|nr:hypothetical protein HHK36_024588 [Tetracentron sinense]
MGKAEKEHLSRALNWHLNTIHETFQVLDQTPPSSLERVSWDEVIKMGDQISKQATIDSLWGLSSSTLDAMIVLSNPVIDIKSGVDSQWILEEACTRSMFISSGPEFLPSIYVGRMGFVVSLFHSLFPCNYSMFRDLIQRVKPEKKEGYEFGMLWTGDAPDVRALEENMSAYFNMLQGFLLLSHGSMVGAGPTLSSSIHASSKQVADCSFLLLKEAVSSYGSGNADRKLSIPQLAGAVWDVCVSLKKTPTTNYTAIGRAITQVAVSVKDVLREMKELKPGSTDPTEKFPNEAAAEEASEPRDNDSSSEGDLGNDLSPEEMKIAQSAIDIVSNTLVVIKELIRFIMSLLKQSNANNISQSVDSLERLLKLCQDIGVQVDELGACLYPPQEVPAMKNAAEKISTVTDEMQAEVRSLEGSSEAFSRSCEGLESSVRQLLSELGCSDTTNLIPKMQNLAM